MRHRSHTESNAAAQEPFLDLVTNVVGILIVLVIVAGLRIKNAPLKEAQDEAVRNAKTALETELSVESAFRTDVTKTTDQVRSLQNEVLKQASQRAILANTVSATERDLKLSREQAESGDRDIFDLQRKLDRARRDLNDLEQDCHAAEMAKPDSILVENYPSPLPGQADGAELHFHLQAGRIAFIPLDRLVEQFKADAHQKLFRLPELPGLTETVGPEGGFQLRYTLERRDSPRKNAPAAGRGSYTLVKRWTLIPVAGDLGEPLAVALADGSQFRNVLFRQRPHCTTVTIWTYPDSFAEFRRLKKELFLMGFATVARPLPEGALISDSPDGAALAAK